MKIKNFNFRIESKGICILSMDNQDSEVNNINKNVIEEFFYLVNKIKADEKIRGVIINSLKKDFHLGYDFKELIKINNSKVILNMIFKLNQTLRSLENSGKKVIIIHKGRTASGGLELALCGHYRIASNDSNTIFALNDLDIGVSMGMGGSQRLPRLLGINKTMDLILNKKILTASEALDLKLIDELIDEDKIINKAKELINSKITTIKTWDDKTKKLNIAKPSDEKNIGLFIGTIAKSHSITKNHYPAVKTFLSCIFEGLNCDIDSGLKIESRYFVWLLNHKETRAMINTLLLNKPKTSIQNKNIEKLKIILDKNYAAEGIRLLLKGISPALIENAGKRLGFNDGPLATADNIGLSNIIDRLDSSDANITALIGLLEKKNRKGKINNAGFFDYYLKKKIKIWEGLEELIALSKNQPDVSAIETQLLFLLINEFSRLADNFLHNIKIEEQDYFSIKKCNFPAWTGGPYRWIKDYGVKNFISKSNNFAENLGHRFIPSEKILKL